MTAEVPAASEQRAAAEVIEHHRPYPNPAHCHCGWKATVDERRFYPGYVPVLQQWSAHVTAALADAGILADRAAAEDHGLRARVTALADGPLSSGYQPYAVEIDGEIHLAVLLDDLRAAMGDDK